MAAPKKETETKVEEVETKVEEAPKKDQRFFKVIDGKNFCGFVDPKTRKMVTANDKGLFVIDADDVKSLAIVAAAADLTDVTDLMK